MAQEVSVPPSTTEVIDSGSERQTLAQRYQQVRQSTEALSAPLAVEDYVIQSMPDCSPTKWHLAHVSWFFETFLLKPSVSDYRPLNPEYAYLFNSYYNAAGDKYPRPQRGLISRPTLDEGYRYRPHVDEHDLDLLERTAAEDLPKVAPIVTLGLTPDRHPHKLITTDLKHLLRHTP